MVHWMRHSLPRSSRKTNEKIWEDTEVERSYILQLKNWKKLITEAKKELTGQVRIVEFPGVDICACCGTHVTHTGEIGMLKLLSVEKIP